MEVPETSLPRVSKEEEDDVGALGVHEPGRQVGDLKHDE